MRSPRTPMGRFDDIVNCCQLVAENSAGRLTRSAARKTAPKAPSPASTDATTPIVLERSINKNPVSGKKRVSIGRWEKWERMAFLKGLRKHGRPLETDIDGNPDEVRVSREREKTYVLLSLSHLCDLCPHRNTIQVKTHAQVVLKKYDEGFNIFQELDDHLQEEQKALLSKEKQYLIQRQNSACRTKQGRPRKVLYSNESPSVKMNPTLPRSEAVMPSRTTMSLSSPSGLASFSATETTMNMNVNMAMTESLSGPRAKVDFSSTNALPQRRRNSIEVVAGSRATATGAISPCFLRFFPSSFEESRHRVAVLSSDLKQQHQTADTYAAAGALLGLAGIHSKL
jgi:hypothetical protein